MNVESGSELLGESIVGCREIGGGCGRRKLKKPEREMKKKEEFS